MEILENIPLARYTTFYIGGPSRYLIFALEVKDIIEAINFAKDKQLPYLIIGGGSNCLVSEKGFVGITIKIENLGMDLVEETDQTVTLKISSGEKWDDVVRFATKENWWGIENLSHIPGCTGALTVQNVGAYGQEASLVVKEVEVIDTKDNQIKTLSNEQIEFDYRKSIFNSIQKGRYIILSTTLVLQKQPQPNLSYGDLSKKFADNVEPTINQIREAVIQIRNQKFPYPDSPERGNSGSFFKGQILTEDQFNLLFEKLKANFSEEVVSRLQSMRDRLQVKQGYKTPSAFLIELCGFKELTIGGAKINPNQPAIIINYTGTATSSDVLALYKQVSSEVFNKTGVKLGIEPELIGFDQEELTNLMV